MAILVERLITMSMSHDNSKLKSPEIDILERPDITPEERKKFSTHHHKYNDHHPEHFKNGLRDMNLLNLIEMFCDWNAKTNARDMVNFINRKNLGDNDMRCIFINTAKLFGKYKWKNRWTKLLQKNWHRRFYG